MVCGSVSRSVIITCIIPSLIRKRGSVSCQGGWSSMDMQCFNF